MSDKARETDLDLIRRSPYRPAASENAARKGLTEDRTRSRANLVQNLLAPRAATTEALKAVASLSQTHSVEFVDESVKAMAGRTQASFRTLIGTVAECLPKEGRSVDLVVTGYDNSPSVTGAF